MLAQASSLCGACREACPVDIDLPGLLLRVRAGFSPQRTQREAKEREGKEAKQGEGVGIPPLVKFGLKGFRFAAGTPPLFALGQRLLGLGGCLLSPRRPWIRLPAWTGWGLGKDFPRLALRPFRARWAELRQEVAEDFPAKGEEAAESNVEETDVAASPVEHFIEELTPLGGKVERLAAADLPARLQALLAEKGASRALSDEAAAPYLGEAAVLRPEPSLPVGVTGALCAIAETGSLVLTSLIDQALTASLLPPVHAVILRPDQIVETVAEALALPEVRRAAAGVIITGPSRTADIEMALTIGVHGPGEVLVFLIDDP